MVRVGSHGVTVLGSFGVNINKKSRQASGTPPQSVMSPKPTEKCISSLGRVI